MLAHTLAMSETEPRTQVSGRGNRRYWYLTCHSRSRLSSLLAHTLATSETEPRTQGFVKEPWDSQPRLKTPLILSDSQDAACDSPRFFHKRAGPRAYAQASVRSCSAS